MRIQSVNYQNSYTNKSANKGEFKPAVNFTSLQSKVAQEAVPEVKQAGKSLRLLLKEIMGRYKVVDGDYTVNTDIFKWKELLVKGEVTIPDSRTLRSKIKATKGADIMGNIGKGGELDVTGPCIVQYGSEIGSKLSVDGETELTGKILEGSEFKSKYLYMHSRSEISSKNAAVEETTVMDAATINEGAHLQTGKLVAYWISKIGGRVDTSEAHLNAHLLRTGEINTKILNLDILAELDKGSVVNCEKARVFKEYDKSLNPIWLDISPEILGKKYPGIRIMREGWYDEFIKSGK